MDKIFVREKLQNYKRLAIELKINNLKLDSLHSIELQSNAVAISNSKKIFSDDFYTDKYFENNENKYVIAFDSIDDKIKNFERLQGTLKYATFSLENKSLLKIKTKNFENKILDSKDENIKIVYLNAFELDKVYNKKRALKKYIKTYSEKFQLDKNIFCDAIESFLKHRYQFKIPKNLVENVFFYAENPKYKVIDIEILNEDNKKISKVTSEHHSDKWTIWEKRYFNSKKSPNEFITKILLENEKSIKYIDFDFKNIVLE